MNFHNLMIVTAVTAIGFGAGFVIAPTPLGAIYGMSSTPISVLALRMFATGRIGIGLLAWLIRKSQDSDLQKSVLLAFIVTDFGAFLVVLFAQLAGLLNVLGWSVVVLLLFLSVAYAYLRFSNQTS